MKSSRFLGQMLALCLPGLAVGLVVFPSGAPALSSANPALPIFVEDLSIRHLEDSVSIVSVIGPEFTQVRQTVQNGYLQAAPGTTTYDILHAALSSAYGAQLIESSEPMGYCLEWDEELQKWRLICLERLIFTIGFGIQGHVVVEVFQKTLMS